MPHRPLTPWTDEAPTGSSTFMTRSMKMTEPTTRRPAMPPMITAAHGADERARRGDGDEAGERAVDRHRGVRLAPELPHQEHRGHHARGTGEQRVGDDDARSAGRQRTSVDMPLKPNQPKNRMIVPRMAIGMW